MEFSHLLQSQLANLLVHKVREAGQKALKFVLQIFRTPQSLLGPYFLEFYQILAFSLQSGGSTMFYRKCKDANLHISSDLKLA